MTVLISLVVQTRLRCDGWRVVGECRARCWGEEKGGKVIVGVIWGGRLFVKEDVKGAFDV